jgi:hypothetical protein
MLHFTYNTISNRSINSIAQLIKGKVYIDGREAQSLSCGEDLICVRDPLNKGYEHTFRIQCVDPRKGTMELVHLCTKEPLIDNTPRGFHQERSRFAMS